MKKRKRQGRLIFVRSDLAGFRVIVRVSVDDVIGGNIKNEVKGQRIKTRIIYLRLSSVVNVRMCFNV